MTSLKFLIIGDRPDTRHLLPRGGPYAHQERAHRRNNKLRLAARSEISQIGINSSGFRLMFIYSSQSMGELTHGHMARSGILSGWSFEHRCRRDLNNIYC